jgi:hypothetical protein
MQRYKGEFYANKKFNLHQDEKINLSMKFIVWQGGFRSLVLPALSFQGHVHYFVVSKTGHSSLICITKGL